MWPKRKAMADHIEEALNEFPRTRRPLPGVRSTAARKALAMQIVASVRRLEYTEILLRRPIDPARADPNSAMFDPERAAILHHRAGRLDEAFWLVFLATHFGRHGTHGWTRLKDVYSGLRFATWTWERVSADPAAFKTWLQANGPRVGGAFGNHRKYESLRVNSTKGTAAVIDSYVRWVGPTRSHASLVARFVMAAGNDPHLIFDEFYRSMQVLRFGRLGKFDFLALAGRIGLAPISPGSTYLKNATGPLSGARLLFAGDPNAGVSESDLEDWIRDLDTVLQVGMQVMEDSLCNWQKSPSHFIHFRG